jgi:hypothetical protein
MSESANRPERLWRDLSQAEAQHLSYDQIEAYVDSRLDPTEAELMLAHTDLCGRCAAEVNDLKAFAASLKADVRIEPKRAGIWERLGLWIKTPRNAWVVAGATAILVLAISLPRSEPSRETSAPSTVATTVPKRPAEAVLEPPPEPLGFAGTKQPTQAPYRVLSQAEADAYRAELAAAPDDPVARAAIAIKYSLFGEAEKEYRKLEGQDAEKGRQLLQQLDQLRGR